MTSLQLRHADIGHEPSGGHVDRAREDSFLFLAVLRQHGPAVNDGNCREHLLGQRFFNYARVLLPSGSFQLESEDIAAVFALGGSLLNLRFPVESLGDVSLDEESVETLTSLLGADLLNGSEEGVWLVQSIQEANSLVNEAGLLLPHVELLKSLTEVVNPRR